MALNLPVLLAISALIFLVAVLYSSVGHGGASGYLAVLALFSLPPEQMAGTALLLNVFVAGLASIMFIRAGHFSARLFWPFAVTSIPLAFLGGWLKLSVQLYYLLLGFALLVAAFRLLLALKAPDSTDDTRPLPLAVALPVGGGVGLLSGMVGVGGGIFLSPLLLLFRWGTVKQTAMASALFILVNSLAGLGGRLAQGNLHVISALPLLAAALAGGALGSSWGAFRLSGVTLRRMLALVLIIAAFRIFYFTL